MGIIETILMAIGYIVITLAGLISICWIVVEVVFIIALIIVFKDERRKAIERKYKK